MPSVHYSPSAANDLVELSEYIARDKPDAAYHWIEEVESTCQLVANNPGLGQARQSCVFGQCRSISMGHFVIFFRAVDNGVEVIRIVRGERDLDRI